MYFAYRKLFQYKHYYFQVAMETFCEIDECKYCRHTKDVYFEECEENSQHFILALYGWKIETSDKLQPYNKILIPDDNIMPYDDWIYQ
jgi:hypothetical protein